MAPAFVGCRLYMAVCEDREWIETNMVLVNVDRPLFLERVHLYRVQGRKPLAPPGLRRGGHVCAHISMEGSRVLVSKLLLR